MNKRKLVIPALILVVLAGGAVLVYALKNDILGVSNPGAKYGCDADGYCVGVDPSKHIGAAKVVQKSELEAAFKPASVGDLKESGTVTEGDTQSETATYKIKNSKGTVEFQVDAKRYKSKADREQANVFVGAEVQKVDNVGEEAHYFVPPAWQEPGSRQVALFAVKDKTSYKFAIVQPADAQIYSEQDAKTILLDIAKKADLSKVQ